MNRSPEDALASLQRKNAEIQTPVSTNVGVIKSAISEISMQARLHGKTFATDMVLKRLKAAIGEEYQA